MTLAAALCAIMAIAVLVLLPPMIKFLGLFQYGGELVQPHRHGDADRLFFVAIALLYRFGPARPTPPYPRIKPGGALAIVLWLIASKPLSSYAARIGSFDATHGSLGAVVGVMLWFYVSAYAVLLGAELNARLEENGADP